MTQTQTIKARISKSLEGFPLLGYAVYWSLENIKITHSDFKALLVKVGLDPDVAPEVRVKSALIRAIRAETKGKKKTFHRKLTDTKDRAGFAIVDTDSVNEENLDVTFETSTRVALDKNTKMVKIEGSNEQSIRDSFDSFRDLYTTDMFRNVVLKLVKGDCQGIGVRPKGGVYFVPSTHNETFQKLQALIVSFPGCSLDVIPVIDTQNAKKSMWKSLNHEIREDLDQLKLEVEELGDDPQDRSVQIRLERYKAIRAKVENYETLLNSTADGLKMELENLTAALTAKLV
mgnify:CR=1 FL=1